MVPGTAAGIHPSERKPTVDISAPVAFVASVLNSFLPTYLTERGYSLWFAGVSLSACQFAAVAGTFLSGIIADRMGKLNTLIIIKILTPILMFTFVAFSLMPNQTVLMEVFIVLTGFFSFSSAPVIMALMQDQGAENPTTTSSIYSMFDFITIAISLTLTLILSLLLSMLLSLFFSAHETRQSIVKHKTAVKIFFI